MLLFLVYFIIHDLDTPSYILLNIYYILHYISLTCHPHLPHTISYTLHTHTGHQAADNLARPRCTRTTPQALHAPRADQHED